MDEIERKQNPESFSYDEFLEEVGKEWNEK
jgi:hypothetical protein